MASQSARNRGHMKTKLFTDYVAMETFTVKLLRKGKSFSVQSDSNGWTVNF